MNKKIIDCNKIGEKIINDLQKEQNEKKFTLACLYFKNDSASQSYLKQIKSQAKKLNIDVKEFIFKEKDKEKQIINKINVLNNEKNIHGIVFLKPSTYNLNYEQINSRIHENKNIDNLKKPATVYAILEVLKNIKDVQDKSIAIVGRGELIGLPLYQYLKKEQYNVQLCHSKTKHIQSILSKSDIIISAVGKPHIIKKEDIKSQAIVIDMGISNIGNTLYGDVDLENVLDKVSYITKTPGGMGILTTVCLLKNLITSNKKPNSK